MYKLKSKKQNISDYLFVMELKKIIKHQIKFLLTERLTTRNPEEIERLAKNYNSFKEFRQKEINAYQLALKIGKDFLQRITSHMPDRRSYKSWDDQKLRDEAKKYDFLSDFRKNNVSAYELARNRGVEFMRDITSHMLDEPFQSREFEYWTDERLENEISKYSNLKDFRENSPSAYMYAYRKGKELFNKLTKDLERSKKNYSDVELEFEAKKYNRRSEFKSQSPNHYRQSIKKGKDFFDKITSHMPIEGNRYYRMIYAFIFPKGIVYIGLTYSFESRKKHHTSLKLNKKSSVLEYIKKTGTKPKIAKLTKYLPYQEAREKEKFFVDRLSKMGFFLLNKVSAGGLGAGINKWTEEKLKQEALKYKSHREFYLNNRSAYETAKNLGLETFRRITSHLPPPKKTHKRTKDELESIAKRYSSHKEFREKDYNAWQSAYVTHGKDFYNSITSHMTNPINPDRVKNRGKRLTDQQLESIVKKYSTMKEFRKNDYAAFQQAYNRGGEFFKKLTSNLKRSR